jgi:hypothetical protein
MFTIFGEYIPTKDFICLRCKGKCCCIGKCEEDHVHCFTSRRPRQRNQNQRYDHKREEQESDSDTEDEYNPIKESNRVAVKKNLKKRKRDDEEDGYEPIIYKKQHYDTCNWWIPQIIIVDCEFTSYKMSQLKIGK